MEDILKDINKTEAKEADEVADKSAPTLSDDTRPKSDYSSLVSREASRRQADKFDAVRIAVASPDQIKEWSFGEVLKPETINYRTQKPERDGLFCEKIFGPIKDFECYCGKYKKVRYKGVICDKCGVEVTRSSVRRERMGHIDLAVPVAHTWYVRGIPSVISSILDISVGDLEKVIYFAGFIVLSVNEKLREELLVNLEDEYRQLKEEVKGGKSNLKISELEQAFRQSKTELVNVKPLDILSEGRYYDLSVKYGNLLRVGIGAESILELLKRIDVDKEIKALEDKGKESSALNKRRELRRLKLFKNFKKAGIRPEWLVMTRIPVIPPDLRPMVQLDGGRFAASDLNDLYRRVINRNNRLKRLLNQGAPEVITRNEKRMLQEAVDALIDNEARRGRNAAAAVGGRRKLRSLSDMLRGKQGRFRQNLLGKRVDYSGRSVIVVGPQLNLNQCGVPKVMALELFKPFVIGRLIANGHVYNVKNATKLIERKDPIVWDLLEEIVSEHYVLINRAPTLHRLGIQAFKPVLIEGKAIQIHPLVCEAFNADFDGDQMAVHVPLSIQAKAEAETIMRSSANILKPASGEPVVSPRQDMVLGTYYLTDVVPGAKGEGKAFSGESEALIAYEEGEVDLRALVKVKIGDQIFETTVGRVIFNSHLPKGIGFVNSLMDKKGIKTVVATVFKRFGVELTTKIIDEIKDLGFFYAMKSGTTFSMDDVLVPVDKEPKVKEAEEALDVIGRQYNRGLITEQERYQKTIELWMNTVTDIQKSMVAHYDKQSPLYWMVVSGARGSLAQLSQMAGMKGLMVNPSGEIIELPIKSNFKEGLDVFEYFISTHGSRKGRADGALRTSEAGYLTRRLVDVSQDTIITIPDCGTKKGFVVKATDSEVVSESLAQRITGRILNQNVLNYKAGTYIDLEIADAIQKAGVSEVNIRSVLYCQADFGVCQACYGEDLATGKMVELGSVVGIMAAQAIGEPGTQLTMKTFQMGGAAGADITTGLPRVEEIFEARMPRVTAVLSDIAGQVTIDEKSDPRRITISAKDTEQEEYTIEEGAEVLVKDGERVKPKQSLFSLKGKTKRAGIEGVIKIKDNLLIVKSPHKKIHAFDVPSNVEIRVSDGDLVQIGEQLTEGHWDLSQALRLVGKEELSAYMIKEIKAIYASQAQNINDKHIEIVLRQMFSKVKVLDSTDTNYLPGDIISIKELEEVNKQLKRDGKKQINAEEMVLGITRVALKTDSFLSAASFQETTNVLLEAAIEGKIDRLRGLKENVIIGKLIPAGSGFNPEDYKQTTDK